MSYLFPQQYAPSRLQIEKSIINLEQRLMRRKELDLQIQKQLLQQQSMNKKNKIIPTNNFFSSIYPAYGMERQLDERLMLLKGLGSRKQLERGIQKQQFDYVFRLRALQRQQQMMQQELALGRRQQSLYGKQIIKNNLERFQEESQVLAKKYLNGTRAIEFNQQLKRAESLNSRKELFTKEKKIIQPTHKIQQHSSIKKYMSSQSKKEKKNDLKSDQKSYKRNDNSIFNRTVYIDPTPIKLIDDSKKTKNQQLLKLQSQISQRKKEIANHLKKIQENQSSDDSVRLQSKTIKKSKDKSTRPTSQFFKVPSGIDFIQQNHVSRQLSSKKSSRFLSSRHQSIKNLRSHQQSTQLPQQDIQQHIHEQIQIRVRISQQVKEVLDIFYAKNVSEYLMTVYQKEDKLRKQLKQKISKIPVVQRKFDVGGVAQ